MRLSISKKSPSSSAGAAASSLLLPLLLSLPPFWGAGGGVEGLLSPPVRLLPEVDLIHRVVLDQQGDYVLLWTPSEDHILFEVQVRTKGYVGLGFSPGGEMDGADVVIGWVDAGGKVQFQDRHATGQKTPPVDDSQDYTLHGGYANDTHTVLRFSRPWVTCDHEDDFPLTGNTVRVIYAYDAVRPDPSRPALGFHDHRGTKSLYLKEPKPTINPAASYDEPIWDIRAPEVELPSNLNTLYWCKLYKMPDLRWKHQMIGYVPLIGEASLPHVHHMLLYECRVERSERHLEKWVAQKGAQCYGKNMPVSWGACGTPIIAWAIGSQGEMLPPDVGFPLGEQHGGATYFLLEIHYDNPRLKTGLVDSSGLRLLLTDTPRRHDAAMVTLGHKVEPTMIIPPRADAWITTAHCTADCTQATLPPEGIRVFSTILHAHLLGREISLRHIRDGRELSPIVKDDTYDFNYQQARVFEPHKVVKPGDHLITTCRYNSTGKSKPTFGGFGTNDEMCLVFAAYYPRINFAECYSRPDLALVLDLFGVTNLYDNDNIMKTFSDDTLDHQMGSPAGEAEDMATMSALPRAGGNAHRWRLVDFFRIINISEPIGLRGQSFYDLVTAEATWRNRGFVARLQEAITSFQYEPNCLLSGKRVVKGLPKKAKYPHFLPFRPPPRECLRVPLQNEDPLRNEVPRTPADDKAAIVEPKFQGRLSSTPEREAEGDKPIQQPRRNHAAPCLAATPLHLLLALAWLWGLRRLCWPR